MRQVIRLAAALMLFAAPAGAQQAETPTAQQDVDQRIDQGVSAAEAPAAPADEPLLSIAPEVEPDASLADPTSSMRLPTTLDAADIEQRIDKGLTAAGLQSAIPPDYAYGAFQRGWFLTAFSRALDRATQGDATAQTLLGELLSRGLGVKQDIPAAADWYRLAATGGDPEAQYALARLYLDGDGIGQDFGKAADYFEMAAKQGHAVAAREFAYLLLQGKGREQNAMLGAAYMRRAAGQGDMDAQYALAGLFVEGVGVVSDDAQAARWFGEAARNGNVGAQVEYAIMLFNGRGVPVNEAAAARWFRRAATSDNPLAQVRLSRLLAEGRGVDKNEEEAARWYIIARDRGVTDDFMDEWLKKLDPDILASATEEASRWTRFDGRPEIPAAEASAAPAPAEASPSSAEPPSDTAASESSLAAESADKAATAAAGAVDNHVE